MFLIEEEEEEKLNEDTFKLKDLNIKIKKGTLTFIIGKIGSGKSTLIHSILNETKKTNSGQIKLYGNSISFCSQHPWIFNATLKENILFNKEYDEERYLKVIKVCALEDDLKLLLNGDQTEIGENGINLSGGQQARVSLARAVYRDSDIYLLDDIFSAVDSHVAFHILKNCILGDLLKDKTILLVTHKLEYINYSDWIILLENQYNQSNIKFQGTKENLSNSISLFTEMDSLDSFMNHDIDDNDLHNSVHQKSNDNQNSDVNDTKIIDDSSSILISEEEHQHGSVKFSIFWDYMKEFGLLLLTFAGKFSFSVQQILIY